MHFISQPSFSVCIFTQQTSIEKAELLEFLFIHFFNSDYIVSPHLLLYFFSDVALTLVVGLNDAGLFL